MNKKILVELHPKEANLIYLIRTRYQYGKIMVECQHGLPYKIEKTIEYNLIPVDFMDPGLSTPD